MPEGDLGPGGMGDEVGAPPAGPIEPGPAGNAPEVSTERLRGMPTASKTASILDQLEREKRERMATNRSRYPRREVGEGSSLRIVEDRVPPKLAKTIEAQVAQARESL